ncbi:putative Ig domain-containing protein [Flammeovirga yaeyamensis]|uniref:Ig domain-containing protein n=1 Tax=Flammeovirga yaeyamensis TaxID=367791 RepID=A0AAX1NBC0_9BACT|nr:putative Ig domain-containing protein [Flammeovirga yaeyamensis]MBB3697294.1 hypothetical protein [Flammeovirga yaeyamensis]NMF33951.1 hypothetical protein [Flammeovirga yaeyamensis]QWG04789.1 putative Ig domain-containing protein [Flammeovirga yaeyamensis]
MKKLLYILFATALLTVVGCQKDDIDRSVGSEYLEDLYYNDSIFTPNQSVESSIPEFEVTYGVAFNFGGLFVNGEEVEDQEENISVDKNTGAISVKSTALFDKNEDYKVSVIAYTVSGVTPHPDAWAFRITDLLYYSEAQPEVGPFLNATIFNLDGNSSNTEISFDEFKIVSDNDTILNAITVDAETGNIQKVNFLDAGEYTFDVEGISGEDIYMANIKLTVGEPNIVYQPNTFTIEAVQDLSVTPITLQNLEGCTFTLEGIEGLNGITIDENGQIEVPVNHNSDKDSYNVTVIATDGENIIEFENALTINVVESIDPSIVYQFSKVTLSPWSAYNLIPTEFTLPYLATVRLNTALPTGMSFDASNGSIAVEGDLNLENGNYPVDLTVITSDGAEIDLGTLSTIVIERREKEVIFTDDMSTDLIGDVYTIFQAQRNETTGGVENDRASAGFLLNDGYRNQMQRWNKDYWRVAYLGLSIDASEIINAEIEFFTYLNNEQQEYRDDQNNLIYREDFFLFGYLSNYTQNIVPDIGGRDNDQGLNDATLSRENSAIIARDKQVWTKSNADGNAIQIPNERLNDNNQHLTMVWKAEKDYDEIHASGIDPNGPKAHNFHVKNITIKANTKFVEEVE